MELVNVNVIRARLKHGVPEHVMEPLPNNMAMSILAVVLTPVIIY